ncbi:MAG: tetratricopeptide repeat protein [Bacteroidota bacterium]
MRKLAVYKTILILIYCVSIPLFSQQEKRSKAFKVKTSPFRILEIRQSDVTYQLWEGFQLMRSANAGDAPSQHELSLRYLTGKGFSYDTIKAALWMKKAADQNYLLAKFNYGIFLNNGWGVEWNPIEAYRYFQYTAKKDMREGEYVYGLFFTDNLVVQRNYSTAYEWLKKSADQNYEPAKDVLKEFEKRGLNGNEALQKDSSSIKRNAARIASAQQSLTQNIEPVMLEFDDDKTVQVDDLTLLKELFNEGNEELRNVLGGSKILSDSVQTDSTGFSMIARAAEIGNPEAMTIVARCYERGIGVRKDKLQAAVHYIRAIRLDSRRAPSLLWRLINEKNMLTTFHQQASKNIPEALYVVSSLNALGLNNSLTDEQALQFLQIAVGKSFTPAVLDLGNCYSLGQWVKGDKKKAKDFWKYASDLGNTEGKIRVAVADLFDGTLTDARRSFDELIKYSDQGSVLAQTALGYCYEKGILVPINYAHAVLFYRKAAQRGNQAAMTALTRMYDERRPKEKEFQISEE